MSFRLPTVFSLMLSLMLTLSVGTVSAQSRGQLEAESTSALRQLLDTVELARTVHEKAIAVLVFPEVTKAGLLVGGQYGEGVLFKKGVVDGFYSTAGVSFGMQAGAQRYGYALFFMDEAALAALSKNDGFEVGVGPSVVVLDQGAARNISTTTMNNEIYAFVFGQKGLMAGVGVQGNKITRLQH